MRTILAVLAASSCAVTAFAQVPTPPPETAALDYFAGSWRMEGEDGKTPFGPGGKVTGEDKCEWFDGNFALVCRGESETATGKARSIASTPTPGITRRGRPRGNPGERGARRASRSSRGRWHLPPSAVYLA
jgi:hypothetical protein